MGEVEQYVWVFPDLLLVPRVATQVVLQDFLNCVDEKAGSVQKLPLEECRSSAALSSN